MKISPLKHCGIYFDFGPISSKTEAELKALPSSIICLQFRKHISTFTTCKELTYALYILLDDQLCNLLQCRIGEANIPKAANHIIIIIVGN